MDRGIELEQKEGFAPYRGVNHLLVIGVDKYEHWNTLNNAARDAKAIRDLLVEQYDFDGQYAVSLFDQAATRKEIIAALRRYEKGKEKALSPQDNLLIYFSGHGAMNSNQTYGYWIPCEAPKDLNQREDFVSNADVKESLSHIDAHHVLIISDACFAGSLITRSTDVETLYEASPSRRVLTSGQIEPVYDGWPGGNSPFALALLETLRANSKHLTTKELESLVARKTVEHLNNMFARFGAKPPFTPKPDGSHILGLEDKGGQFVFRPRRDEAADYEAAKAVGSSQALVDFLQGYPEFPQKTDAEDLIRGLQDEEAWAKAKRINSIQAYHSYWQHSGTGKYRDEALRLMEKLYADMEWEKASRRDTIVSYEGFIERYPNSEHRSKAEASIADLLAKDKPLLNKLLQKPGRRIRWVTIIGIAGLFFPILISELLSSWLVLKSGKTSPTSDLATSDQLNYSPPDSAFHPPTSGYTKFDPENTVELSAPYIFPQLVLLGGYHQDIARYEEAGKTGYVRRDGNRISPARYDRGEDFKNGAAIVHLNGKRGYIDLSGKEIIKPQYDLANDFDANGFSLVVNKGRKFFIDKTGAEVFPEENMVFITAGTFPMGGGEYSSNPPLENKSVSGFRIGQYEVTRRQWRAVMGKNPLNLRQSGCDNCPVASVSWEEVEQFIKKLNEKTGLKYRLPSIAEWEYAAGGGSGSRTKYAGTDSESSLGSYAWYSPNSRGDTTYPVGEKTSNSLGLYDMSGNVQEWCQISTSASSGLDNRAIRGGGFRDAAKFCEVRTNYLLQELNYRKDDIGFRLAR